MTKINLVNFSFLLSFLFYILQSERFNKHMVPYFIIYLALRKLEFFQFINKRF